MLSVLRTRWTLLFGVGLLMIGNGMQSTLIGIRGGLESIGTGAMSIVMAAYFAGFLAGSMTIPQLIARVGHVRVFAALGSTISAILILYPAWPTWPAWTIERILIGYCFCGVYVTAESWLNASATNENRGQVLSAYMIVQMGGIVVGQGLLTLNDPAGYMSFIIPSVLVSLAFTPVLLLSETVPRFDSIRPMNFRGLWEVSHLSCVGMFMVGGLYASLIGMAPVWGIAVGLNTFEISAFVASIYTGSVAFQWPVGKLSDRVDRRKLLVMLAAVGLATVIAVLVTDPGITGLVIAGAILGAVINPAYSLVLAYTNDLIDTSDMAAASAGLLFLNGAGSVIGPLVTGWLMAVLGLHGYWVYSGALLIVLGAYTSWRLTRRETAEPTASFTTIVPGTSTIVLEAALDVASPDPVPEEGDNGEDAA